LALAFLATSEADAELLTARLRSEGVEGGFNVLKEGTGFAFEGEEGEVQVSSSSSSSSSWSSDEEEEEEEELEEVEVDEEEGGGKAVFESGERGGEVLFPPVVRMRGLALALEERTRSSYHIVNTIKKIGSRTHENTGDDHPY